MSRKYHDYKIYISYLCPNTQKRTKIKLKTYTYDYFLQSYESYDNSYIIELKIMDCPECKKKHEIELSY